MCAWSLSCWTLVTSWTVACQAPLSMGFFRQEYIGVACHFLLQGLRFLACKIIVNNAIDLFDKEHWKKVHCSPGSISCFFLVVVVLLESWSNVQKYIVWPAAYHNVYWHMIWNTGRRDWIIPASLNEKELSKMTISQTFLIHFQSLISYRYLSRNHLGGVAKAKV